MAKLWYPLFEWCNVTNESEKKERRASFETMGRRMDEEIEKLISYINDEVVPTVRQHSSKGLRIAAERLKQFADYMDEGKSSTQPRNNESDEDIGS
jgi:hypothetical protein